YVEQSALAQGIQTAVGNPENNAATLPYAPLFGTALPVVYCPSDPRPPNTVYTNNTKSPPQTWGETWYVAVTGVTYSNYQTGYFNGSAFFVGDPTGTQSGILSVTYQEVLGSQITLIFHGSKISQITDGLSNTVMIGERPPSQDFMWGRWANPGNS